MYTAPCAMLCTFFLIPHSGGSSLTVGFVSTVFQLPAISVIFRKWMSQVESEKSDA
jgi:hypothetical protein